MKYIKTFETRIKASDPIAVNNRIRNISLELKKVIEEIKKIDTQKSICSINYSDSGSISINYSYPGSTLFRAELKIVNRYQWKDKKNEWVNIDFYINNARSPKIDISKFLEFLKILKYNLKDYIRRYEDFNEEKSQYTFFVSFPLSKLDNILDKSIEEYYLYLDTTKYNL